MKAVLKQIVSELKSHANPENVKGMARFGISSENTLGISIPVLRLMAKRIGKDHELAQELWKSKIHEARLLATFIDDPKLITENQLNEWVRDFNSWDICDQACVLFVKTPFVQNKIAEWTKSEEEFIKRAGFVLIAVQAVHDKKAADKEFTPHLKTIKKGSDDNRNFVKKAVNWALRQIGKRNAELNKAAIITAEEIFKTETKSGRWIANDAIKELTSEAVKERIAKSKK